MTEDNGLKNWSTGWVQIPNETAQDSRLSARARGVLVLVLSLPDGWQLHSEWLIKQFSEGRDSVMNAVRELRKHGYYRVERRRRVADGTFTTGVSVSNISRTDWIAQHAAACAEQDTEKPKWDVSRRLLPDGRVEDQPLPVVPPDSDTATTEGDAAATNHRKRPTSDRKTSDGKPGDWAPGDGLKARHTQTHHQDTRERPTTDPMSSHLGNARGASRPRRPPTAEIDPSPVTQSGPVAEMDGPGYLRDWQALRERLSGKKPGAYGATG